MRDESPGQALRRPLRSAAAVVVVVEGEQDLNGA